MTGRFLELLDKMTDAQLKEVLRLYAEGFIPPGKEHTP